MTSHADQVPDGPDRLEEPEPIDSPLLELRGVGRSFVQADGGELRILAGIDLELEAGRRISILGPSGSGKSTLLNLMGSLDRPSTGAVLLEGRDLSGLKDRELARIRNRKVGFVFQQHHLLPQCSLLENILLPTLPFGGPDDSALERALELADRVGLSDRLDHFPGKLSGGECQRVAVVRSLINRPLLLLADEPTGALDEQNAQRIGELLIALNEERGVTLVVVTHARGLAEAVGGVHELRHHTLRPATEGWQG